MDTLIGIRNYKEEKCTAKSEFWYKGKCSDPNYKTEISCIAKPGVWLDNKCIINTIKIKAHEYCSVSSNDLEIIIIDDLVSVSFEDMVYDQNNKIKIMNSLMPTKWKNSNVPSLELHFCKFNKNTDISNVVMPSQIIESNLQNKLIGSCKKCPDYISSISGEFCILQTRYDENNNSIVTGDFFSRLSFIENTVIENIPNKADLSYSVFKNIHMRNFISLDIDFSNVRFINVIFENVVFQNSNFYLAIFEDCKFIDTSFNTSSLINTNIKNVVFNNVDIKSSKIKLDYEDTLNISNVSFSKNIFEDMTFQNIITNNIANDNIYINVEFKISNLRMSNSTFINCTFDYDNINVLNYEGNTFDTNIEINKLPDIFSPMQCSEFANEVTLKDINLNGYLQLPCNLSKINFKTAKLNNYNMDNFYGYWKRQGCLDIAFPNFDNNLEIPEIPQNDIRLFQASYSGNDLVVLHGETIMINNVLEIPKLIGIKGFYSLDKIIAWSDSTIYQLNLNENTNDESNETNYSLFENQETEIMKFGSNEFTVSYSDIELNIYQTKFKKLSEVNTKFGVQKTYEKTSTTEKVRARRIDNIINNTYINMLRENSFFNESDMVWSPSETYIGLLAQYENGVIKQSGSENFTWSKNFRGDEIINSESILSYDEIQKTEEYIDIALEGFALNDEFVKLIKRWRPEWTNIKDQYNWDDIDITNSIEDIDRIYKYDKKSTSDSETIKSLDLSWEPILYKENIRYVSLQSDDCLLITTCTEILEECPLSNGAYRRKKWNLNLNNIVGIGSEVFTFTDDICFNSSDIILLDSGKHRRIISELSDSTFIWFDYDVDVEIVGRCYQYNVGPDIPETSAENCQKGKWISGKREDAKCITSFWNTAVFPWTNVSSRLFDELLPYETDDSNNIWSSMNWEKLDWNSTYPYENTFDWSKACSQYVATGNSIRFVLGFKQEGAKLSSECTQSYWSNQKECETNYAYVNDEIQLEESPIHILFDDFKDKFEYTGYEHRGIISQKANHFGFFKTDEFVISKEVSEDECEIYNILSDDDNWDYLMDYHRRSSSYYGYGFFLGHNYNWMKSFPGIRHLNSIVNGFFHPGLGKKVPDRQIFLSFYSLEQRNLDSFPFETNMVSHLNLASLDKRWDEFHSNIFNETFLGEIPKRFLSLSTIDCQTCNIFLGPANFHAPVVLSPGQEISGTPVKYFSTFGMKALTQVFDWNKAKLNFVEIYMEESRHMLNMLWSGTEWRNVNVWNFKPRLDTNVSQIEIMYGMRGQMILMDDCGPFKDYNKNNYHCQDGIFIGPGADLTNVDCSNLILDIIPKKMHGICGCSRGNTECEYNTCPKPYNLPVSIYPGDKTPFITTCVNGVIFHPRMNHNNIDLSNAQLSGIDARGQDWTTYILKGVVGRLEKCPNILPPGYHCINKYIVGPGVNLLDADFKDHYMHHIPTEDMRNVKGRLFSCPETTPNNIKCVFDVYTKLFNFVGEGIAFRGDMTSIDLNNANLDRRRRLVSRRRQNELLPINQSFSFDYMHLQGGGCPPIVPNWYKCYKNSDIYYMIGPRMDLSRFNLSGADLRTVDLRGTHGVLGKKSKCPLILPEDWSCKGLSNNYKLYGPNSHYKYLDISNLNASDTSWTLFNSTVDEVDGTFADKLCPSQDRLPKNFVCYYGELFGYGSNFVSVDILPIISHDNSSLDLIEGMKLTLFQGTPYQKKFNLVKSCIETHKKYYKTCSSFIKNSPENYNADIDMDENELSRRRLKHSLSKIKEKYEIKWHHSMKTPINKKIKFKGTIRSLYDSIRAELNTGD